MSTGAGPFTYYHSLSGRAGAPRRPYAVGPSSREVAKLEKAQQAQALEESLQTISHLHMPSFEPAGRPTATMSELPGFPTLLKEAEAEELQGLSVFKRSARREARATARLRAEKRAGHLLAQAQAVQKQRQAELDGWWLRLLENDPATVLGALSAAFEDNEAPVAPVGVDGAEALIVVLVPSVEAVPDRFPSVTDAGNLSIRKMTKSMRYDYHRQLVAGHALVSAKEALAVALGLTSVSLVVLQGDGDRIASSSQSVPVLCTRLARQALDAVTWSPLGAWDFIERRGTDTLVHVRGVAKVLQPLELGNFPELAEIVRLVDFEEGLD